MTLLISLLLLLWIIRIALNLLSYIHLWYIKEYRFDRMLIHLSTKQGKRLLFIPWKLPPLKPKSFFIFVLSALSLTVILIYLPLPIVVKFLIADVCTFPVTALLVLLFKIPTYFYHELLIRKAMRMLGLHKKMTVIGITGSYGKTSTKEILSTILSSKYSVLKTEASKNSPIAIAETIVHSLKPHHDIFIVEMGAYKRGEIARMCQIAHPEIGIITAINAQHQDLFGSIETTMKAKYELIQGLTGRKIALFNVDNTHVRQMAEWAKKDGKTVKSYSVADSKAVKNADYRVHTVKLLDTGLSFIFEWKNQKKQVTVGLTGAHQAQNVLAALSIALLCGMSMEEAVEACRNIAPFSKTMNLIHGYRGSLFVDDTFNNNPDAARAALDYLATRPHHRILVFQPMIELGGYSNKSHHDVGKLAAQICDDVILTNDNYLESFIEGMHEVDTKRNPLVLTPPQAASYLSHRLQKGDTVLFKGREAALTLNVLVKKKN